MFPVDFFKLFLWPLPCVSQQLSGKFHACVKANWLGYIICDLVPPDDYGDVSLG